MSYTFDSYQECITNGEDTYAAIVADLVYRGHVVTTWTDEDGCKADIVWSFDATRVGRSSMIDAGPGKIFVGIVGAGTFGFSASPGLLAPGYVREKLGFGSGLTGEKLAQLLTAVRQGVYAEIHRPRPTVQQATALTGEVGQQF